MLQLLLAIIYLSFISLGLPDSLLGSAWPSMYREFSVPVSYAGIISMIIAAGTIVSSLYSDRLTGRFATGRVTAASVGLTCLALFGFSFSHTFGLLVLWAVPYGLGTGAVDDCNRRFDAGGACIFKAGLYGADCYRAWLCTGLSFTAAFHSSSFRHRTLSGSVWRTDGFGLYRFLSDAAAIRFSGPACGDCIISILSACHPFTDGFHA